MIDSACVLYQLKTSKPLPLFVENRVKEIQREKDIVCHYVPSEQNPADLTVKVMVEWSRMVEVTPTFMATMESSCIYIR